MVYLHLVHANDDLTMGVYALETPDIANEDDRRNVSFFLFMCEDLYVVKE